MEKTSIVFVTREIQFLNPITLKPKKTNMKLNKPLAAVPLLAMLPMASSAALITWSPSVDMYADGAGVDGDESFVNNTSGIFVLGYSGTTTGTASAATVNGVSFAEVNAAALIAGYTDNGVTTTHSNGRDTPTAFGDGSFSGNANIQNLLRGGIFDAATITLSGLTIGDTYVMQIFTNDARTSGGRNNLWQTGFSDGTQNFADSFTAGTHGISNLNNRDSVTFAGETSGDSIIGTFVADATTQSFDHQGTRNAFDTNSGGQGQINAFQLRVISVPEPSSAALLGLGGLALLQRRRK